jgi:hypothetical protein
MIRYASSYIPVYTEQGERSPAADTAGTRSVAGKPTDRHPREGFREQSSSPFPNSQEGCGVASNTGVTVLEVRETFILGATQPTSRNAFPRTSWMN